MKIKEFSRISTMPCSVMCIIGDNQLNKELKDIENPQHTDWEPNRKNNEALRKEIKNIIMQLKNYIVDFVIEVLSTSETEKLDIEGAGDYLPESNMDDSDITGGEQEISVAKETPIIVKKVQNKKFSKNPIVETETLEGLVPDIGGIEEGDDLSVPTGSNTGSAGTLHEGDEEKGSTEDGDEEILRRVPLTDMKKVFFVANKEKGEYIAIIDSVYDESDCELEVKYFDDAGNQYNANILECTINGTNVDIEDGKAVRFKITRGKTKAVITTNLTDYYRCEVKLYANRK